MAKRSVVHISSPSFWRKGRERLRRSQHPISVSRRELYTMLLYVILMLIAILVGMYVGWWSLVREEEEITPPANTHSKISCFHSRVT